MGTRKSQGHTAYPVECHKVHGLSSGAKDLEVGSKPGAARSVCGGQEKGLMAAQYTLGAVSPSLAAVPMGDLNTYDKSSHQWQWPPGSWNRAGVPGRPSRCRTVWPEGGPGLQIKSSFTGSSPWPAQTCWLRIHRASGFSHCLVVSWG